MIVSQRKLKTISVVHLPVYGNNPYQKLLMDALRTKGVTVVDGGGGGYFFRTALRVWRADILHFHWLHPYLLRPTLVGSLCRGTCLLLELMILKLCGQRIVWTVHNLANHAKHQVKLERFFTRLFARLADGMIAHTEYSKREAIRYFGLNPAKITVIPHGSYIGHYPDTISRVDARNDLKIKPDDFVFLFLGRIETYKGVLALVREFKRVSDSQIYLLIAGGASDDTLVLKIKEQSDSIKNISFLPGFVPDERIQYFMKAADIVVFPYRDILNSGALIMAMSFGRPCIAPKLGAMPEILGYHGGILYNPKNPDGLFLALKQAVESKPEVAAMGRLNQVAALKWTWETVAQRTQLLYEQCLLRQGQVRINC